MQYVYIYIYIYILFLCIFFKYYIFCYLQIATNARYSSMIKLKKIINQLLLDHKVKNGLQITILSLNL